MLITLMMIKLVQEKDATFSAIEWSLLGSSTIIGVFVSRLILFLLVKPEKVDCGKALAAIFAFWSAKSIEQLLEEKVQQT